MKSKIDAQELKNTLKTLEKYICFIFDNDKSFIKHFCLGDIMDLTRVSFTTHTCDITYALYNGQHVTNSIPVFDVIDWIDGLK